MNQDETPPPSPASGALALVPTDPDWQPVLHASNQVVLYHATSHALAIRPSHNPPERLRHTCHYCKQVLPDDFEPESESYDQVDVKDPAYHSRATDYFRLLTVANESSSQPPTPLAEPQHEEHHAFPSDKMAEGYFKAFFQEEYRLGMGANGSVFLCQHVLDGNPLGYFAVKKIAVGESQSYLLNILREVRLLERLHHPNIVTYHHAWLESCQFSNFGPRVPTLHVLMQWAEGGSLDDFIDVRLGRPVQHIHVDPLGQFLFNPAEDSHISLPSPQATPDEEIPSFETQSRSARIRAFRAYQRASPEEKARLKREMEGERGKRNRTLKAVHLLSADEVRSLFADVVEGLRFLHNKSILHLDLKPGNVLLTWDEGKLTPRAMLSDFGTSRDMLRSPLNRSGNTGTLEYTSPESLPSPVTGALGQVDSKSDMWSLGMILHKLLFFKLPYRYAAIGDANGEPISADRESDKMDRLEKEVLAYPGFKSSTQMNKTFQTRRLPRAYLILLESLLSVQPSSRPSCERVSQAIQEGKLDPVVNDSSRSRGSNSIVTITRRRRDTPPFDTLENVSSSLEVANGSELEQLTPRMTPTPISLGEKNNLLGPPTPPSPLSLDNTEEPVPDSLKQPGNLVALTREKWKTILKSCVLVAKVATALSMCSAHGGPRHSLVLTVLLVAAVTDTVVDDIRTSILLALFHVGVVIGGPRTLHCS